MNFKVCDNFRHRNFRIYIGYGEILFCEFCSKVQLCCPKRSSCKQSILNLIEIMKILYE